MRLGTKPFESSSPEDQLAWLVLRVIAALSPCTRASIIYYVIAAGDSNSKVGQGTFTPRRRKLIGYAFLKLKGFAFIRFTQEQIAITDKGRQFLSELELIASRRDDRSVKTAEINRELQAQPRALHRSVERVHYESAGRLNPADQVVLPRPSRRSRAWLSNEWR